MFGLAGEGPLAGLGASGIVDPDVPLGRSTLGCVAYREGDALAVGRVAQIGEVADLGGRLAIPGFIEGHGHFTGVGAFKMTLNLRDARTWDDIVAMVGAAAREAKPGDWIIGRGWHQAKWQKVPAPNVEGFPIHSAL